MDASRREDSPPEVVAERQTPPSPPLNRRLLSRLASLKWAVESLSAMVQVVAIIAAGSWALYTFVYEAQIKPNSEPPVLVSVAHMERVGQRDGKVAIRISSTIRNIGKVRLRLLTSIANVYAMRVKFDNGLLIPRRNEGLPDVINRTRDFHETSSTVILTFAIRHKLGGGKDYDTYLDPSEEVQLIQDIVYVDQRKFDQALVLFRYDFIRERNTPFQMELKTDSKGAVYVKPIKCQEESIRCPISTEANAGISLW